VLSGCTETTTAGVATFSGCKIDKAGTGYTLTATDATDSLNTASAPSSTFNITVGPAASPTFSTQPSTTATGGSAFAIQPQVTVKDAGGNLVTSSPVNLAVTAGSGTLSCTTNPVNSNGSGISVFAGCSINTASATAYTLTATEGSATATSTGITVSVGPAAQLVFSQPPSDSTGGAVFGTQPKVTIEDAGGNIKTTDTSTVVLAIGTNGGPGGVLSGCTETTTAGVATFSGCKIDKAGSGYTLTATDATDSLNTASAPSSSFNITVGPAAQLVFTQSPSNSTGGVVFGTQPKVTIA